MILQCQPVCLIVPRFVQSPLKVWQKLACSNKVFLSLTSTDVELGVLISTKG